RVKKHRLIGYYSHQLKMDDFRNNAVDAAEIGAAESGNAVYVLQIEEKGTGPLGRVHVRYREPSTNRYKEMSWLLPHRAKVPALAEASTAMRLAASSATFAEWLGRSPFSTDVELPKIQQFLLGLEKGFPSDSPVRSLQQMVGYAYRIVPR
ncbi:MAG: YfbK domain-containing protein, partial [Opitutae bacterium]